MESIKMMSKKKKSKWIFTFVTMSVEKRLKAGK